MTPVKKRYNTKEPRAKRMGKDNNHYLVQHLIKIKVKAILYFIFLSFICNAKTLAKKSNF